MRNTYKPTGSDAEKEECSAFEHGLVIKRKAIGFIGAGVACSVLSFGVFLLNSPGKRDPHLTAWGPAEAPGSETALQERFRQFGNKTVHAERQGETIGSTPDEPLPLPSEHGGVTKPVPAQTEPRNWQSATDSELIRYWLSSAKVSPTDDSRDSDRLADSMVSYRQVQIAGYRMEADGNVRILNEEFHRTFPAKARAKNPGIRVIASILTPSDADWSDFMSNKQKVQYSAFENLAQFAEKHGFQGLNLEIPQLQADSRDELATFVEQLADALHKKGVRLSVSFKPHLFQLDGNPDPDSAAALKRIGQAADEVTLIQERPDLQKRPGPISPLAWTEQVMNRLTTLVPAHKAFAEYRKDAAHWSNNTLVSRTLSDLLEILEALTGISLRDENGELHASFSIAGYPQVIYAQDLRSMKYKMKQLREKHEKLGGVFIELSSDDESS
ncbi:glycosyl hydrolase family 18 protein [Staphylospora marina]|uniref:glycosyl hydrolase family 18 protein n=1 Tax=Staphylospora marina TaxID=2490858 RepID=UPI000F5BE323|nr:glycosyl hydrolase family 18 protein [Staphylospora marina]